MTAYIHLVSTFRCLKQLLHALMCAEATVSCSIKRLKMGVTKADISRYEQEAQIRDIHQEWENCSYVILFSSVPSFLFKRACYGWSNFSHHNCTVKTAFTIEMWSKPFTCSRGNRWLPICEFCALVASASDLANLAYGLYNDAVSIYTILFLAI
jgi:hypothetical protein